MIPYMVLIYVVDRTPSFIEMVEVFELVDQVEG